MFVKYKRAILRENPFCLVDNLNLNPYIEEEDFKKDDALKKMKKKLFTNLVSNTEKNDAAEHFSIRTLLVKFDFCPGSHLSKDLLRRLENYSPDHEIFSLEIIEEMLLVKFGKVRWVMVMEVVLYLAYMVCLHGIFFLSLEYEAKVLLGFCVL
jgi:hypothetical protein